VREDCGYFVQSEEQFGHSFALSVTVDRRVSWKVAPPVTGQSGSFGVAATDGTIVAEVCLQCKRNRARIRLNDIMQ
jgi:hypothetical protein